MSNAATLPSGLSAWDVPEPVVQRAPSFRWFALCIMAPVLFDFLRKVLPGRPYFLLAAAYPVIFIAWLVTLMRHGNRMPASVRFPLGLWIIYQLGYWVLAVARDLEMGMTSFFTHIAPIGMAWIAYAAMSQYDGLRKAFRVYGIIGICLLPFGMYAIVVGTASFPAFLLPNPDIIDLGMDVRVGFSAFAGIFNTQAVMAMTFMAVAYLAMAYSALGGKTRLQTFFVVAIMIISVVLVFSSTRRGALLGILPGIVFVVLLVRSAKVKSILLVAVLAAVATMFYLDTRSEQETAAGQQFHGRLGFLAASDFSDRYQNVFLHYWLVTMRDYPMGTMLGSASREGIKLGMHEWSVTEVGAAAITKETGILGSMVLLSVVIWLIVYEWRRSRTLDKRLRAFCHLLIVFQIVFFILWFCKEKQAVGGATLAHILFWAVPGIIAGVSDREAAMQAYESEYPPEYLPAG